MWQKWFGEGYVGNDPELRYTPNGTAVCNVSLAVADGWGDNKKTIWFRIAFWGKTAETVAKYVVKGRPIRVEGRVLEPNVWKDRSGESRASLEVNAQSFGFLPWKRDDDKEQSESSTTEQPPDKVEPNTTAKNEVRPIDAWGNEDEIPF